MTGKTAFNVPWCSSLGAVTGFVAWLDATLMPWLIACSVNQLCIHQICQAAAGLRRWKWSDVSIKIGNVLDKVVWGLALAHEAKHLDCCCWIIKHVMSLFITETLKIDAHCLTNITSPERWIGIWQVPHDKHFEIVIFHLVFQRSSPYN